MYVKIVWLFSCLFFTTQSYAMDEQFLDFITIGQTQIKQIIQAMPTDKPHWKSGQTQCFYALAWTRLMEKNPIDFDLEVDNQANFNQFIPPPKLTSFIAQRMSKNALFSPQLIRFEDRDVLLIIKALSSIIESKINNGIPLLVYNLNHIETEKPSLVLTTIIGYQKIDNSIEKLLILNNSGVGKNKIVSVDASEFMDSMNMDNIRWLFSRKNSLYTYDGPLQNEVFNELKSFNFITFQPTTPVECIIL